MKVFMGWCSGTLGWFIVVISPLILLSFFPSHSHTWPDCEECICHNSFRVYSELQKPTRKKPNESHLFGKAGEEILAEMKAENIEKNLRYLTSQGHMAGTVQDLEQAEYIKKQWEDIGLHQVILQPYNVQLSFPDKDKPSKVYLYDDKGVIKFTSSIMEDGTYDDSIPPSFLAFSPAATIHANELVFVNYGRYEDFLKVEEYGINVSGRLVIAKFGGGFRGDKVKNAQRFNASGVIMYTDPSDYHPDWQNGTPSYPSSIWLPGSGIQRGSIVWHDGDPTTPLYPALDGSYRVPDNNTDTPLIPAHTISYNDARKLLVNMGGKEVPAEWKGSLNITYRMGPQLNRRGWSIKLEVNNIKKILPTYNVLGVIKGSQEPDRYIIYGNHRDSWTFGSCDPSSATAVQMEMVRAYGKLLDGGWKPRRTIIFGSWGAGEYGFFGTTELVEEYLKVLGARGVAHLNVDLAIIYTYNLLVSATPLLHRVIEEATKMVPAPDPSLGFNTVWDHWSQRVRAAGPDMIDYNLGSISEHSPFYQRLGIPSSYMLWEVNLAEYNWNDYPLYHTTFEDFEVMKNILDPEFNYHLALGRLWALMGIALADNLILPMDPRDETVMLRKMVEGLKTEHGSTLYHKGITLDHVEAEIDRFEEVATKFYQDVSNITNISPLKARQLNDQLIMIEKCFIDSEGSPSRPYMKNMMFGTSNFNQYQGWLAPALRDAIWDANNCDITSNCITPSCSSKCHELWGVVEQQVSVLQFVIHSAVLIMKDMETI